MSTEYTTNRGQISDNIGGIKYYIDNGNEISSIWVILLT